MTHRYIPISNSERKEMLKEIGVSAINDLYSDVPDKYMLEKELELPGRLSEPEVKKHVKKIFSKNKPASERLSFLGGGVWNHYIPEHVRELVTRSEFLTSYTPYQAEVSQGTLQALFEYQSTIAELVDLPVVNASMYGWGSALGEAALMSSRLTHQDKFLIPEYISPGREAVLRTYTEGPGIKLSRIPQDKETGELDLSQLEAKIGEDTAGIYVEIPSYLGFIETQMKKIGDIAEENETLFVVGVNPISLGLLKPPGEYGADIVIGEGQPFGNPMSLGGPLLGIFACRDDREFVHQLPGRLSGMTKTKKGEKRGFVMALQTREQHIRRERATSNICTNNNLYALVTAVYLSSLGSKGLKKLAKKCAGNARYAIKKLNNIDGIDVPVFDAPHFNEFTISFKDAELSA
ncbi:hypothetical protein AKJ40_04790, partial [candidate division MSBL1 archaeon SCGC-AAA259M10]